MKQSLQSPSSYQFVFGDVLWSGETDSGERGYVVRVAYDAQNGFGALLRGCAFVAYGETAEGKIRWSREDGVYSQQDQCFCLESTPASMLVELSKTFADLNFKSQ